jgi:type II secretory pathway pseudopilin PulG
MFSTDRGHQSPSEAGFSLLEMLVASLISILIVGGILIMLDGIQQVYRDQMQIMDSQQSARLALEQMQRDLQLAGVGLAWMLSPLPAIVPRADGGFDIRHNQGGVTAVLVEDMPDTTSHFAVNDVSGFEIGMVVAVYDSTGTMDLVTLTDITTDERQHLHHDGASKAYSVAEGASVARVLTISYWVDTVDVLSSLMRQEDDVQAQPVAHYVRSLNVGYFNDNRPPQLFTPMTVADQLRIRMVEIQITVEVENTRLTVGDRPAVTLTSRVTPRAMVLY